MAFVEIITALIGPALEIALPAIYYLLEFIFWLILLFLSLMRALFTWSKPVKVEKPTFTKMRNKTSSFSERWKESRNEKSKDKDSS